MFVVFEGIDGSGKTTLSNRLAEALRAAGLRVEHVREGGKFASAVTQAIRELARDLRNLECRPLTELLLYTARDAQLYEEAIRPALARADVVLADRFFYTAEVLAKSGRGLSAAEVDPIVCAAARGVVPDRVVLVDIDPHVARARRRVSKIVTPDSKPPSRKGLAGVGLQHRLRDGYRALARDEGARWLVVDNTEADLDDLVAYLVAVVQAARVGGPSPAPLPARSPASRVGTPDQALDAFLGWVDRRAIGEPAVAAYFLAGLWGAGVDERRRSLAGRAPEVVAAGLRGLTDPVSWRLREELAERAPRLVARSLAGLAGEGEAARALRVRLAPRVPEDVAASLDGRDDAGAWSLRSVLWDSAPDAVVASLKRIGSPRAWALREEWLRTRGGPAALASETARVACEAVTGLDDDRAWEIRKAGRTVAPVAALDSLAGVVSERAWKWRARALERAPKVVLRTIVGLDDPRAWALREAAAPRCKEALDSMIGLDGVVAWRLREACAKIWPSTVVKSLGELGATAQGAALVSRLLAQVPGNISLWKHAAALALRSAATLETATG